LSLPDVLRRLGFGFAGAFSFGLHGTLKVFPCFRPFDVFCFPFHHKQIMRLLVFCILLASLAIQVVGQNSQPDTHRTTNKRQEATDAKNPQPQVVIQSQSNNQAADQQNSARKNVEHSFLTSPEWISAASTLGILVATIVYAFISYHTLQKIKRQAELYEETGHEMVLACPISCTS
jgi:hypothetical protein